MIQLQKFIQLQTKSGRVITAGEVEVTPVSRVLIVRWPSGGWIWNRPVSVGVRHNHRSTGGTGRTDCGPHQDCPGFAHNAGQHVFYVKSDAPEQSIVKG